MEMMMYFGKEVNMVEIFTMFKKNQQELLFKKSPTTKANFEGAIKEEFETEMMNNFNKAVAALKYMGFISATRQSTFLFKKNIFGKPKYYSVEGVL